MYARPIEQLARDYETLSALASENVQLRRIVQEQAALIRELEGKLDQGEDSPVVTEEQTEDG